MDDGPQPPSYYDSVATAHGVLSCLGWVIFLPAGAIVIRALNGPNAWKIHVAIQIFGTLLIASSFGMGVWMWKFMGYSPTSTGHPVIGTIIFGLALLSQTATGWLHHIKAVKTGTRSLVSYVHIWLGRILITVGMINGGLGLLLGGDSTYSENVAYGVVAGVIWATWLGIDIFYEVQRHRNKHTKGIEEYKG